MKTKNQLAQEIKECENMLKEANSMHQHLKPSTTKFEITMTIEVVDVGNIPASPEALRDSIITEIEGISSGDEVKVKSMMIIGKS